MSVHVARAELVLARPAHEPLAELGLDPDPLQSIAAVYADLDDDLCERAEVIVDVLPLTAGETRRARRAMRRQARRDAESHDSQSLPRRRTSAAGRDPLGLDDLLHGSRPARRGLVETAERQPQLNAVRAKAIGHDQLLCVQVLLRAESQLTGRAKGHLTALLACFDQFAARNRWRAVGSDLPGLGFLGSDGPARRRRFDRRASTGRFRRTAPTS